VARVKFLGCGDAFSSGGRFQACLYLDGGEAPLLLDCGATGLVAIKRSGLDPGRIGHVALTHLHGDHFGGLPYLILDGQFSARTRPLVIAGPTGTKARLEATYEALYPGLSAAERTFAVEYLQLEAGAQCTLGDARVTPFEVPHSSGARAYALRIEYADKVIAYSGDTGWTDNLIALAAGADLFVCECTFLDPQAANHLDYRTLLERRGQIDCKRLVITHMGEEMLSRVGQLQIETAADGLEIHV
jgi:ribonuclease BN (tRNA processing enzyme)